MCVRMLCCLKIKQIWKGDSPLVADWVYLKTTNVHAVCSEKHKLKQSCNEIEKKEKTQEDS